MKEKLREINLFIPGAAKSGTSTLHELLKLHPDINMSKQKEPHFLTSSKDYLYSDEGISSYLSNFDYSKKYQYRGESSTGYFYFKEFKDNFKTIVNPNSKFILILRNPIDRTFSHYNYLKSLGSEDSDLKLAVLNNYKNEPNPNDILPELMVKNYYQYSLYGKWFTLLRAELKEENIKIILFENLRNKPLETLNSCFDFLNLKNLEEIPEIKLNKTVQIRFPKLYRKVRIFAFNESKFRNIVKHVFPSKFRRRYKNRITQIILNVIKTKKNLPIATSSQRKWLHSLFKEDVQEFKKVTGLSLHEWKEFSKDQ